MANRNISSADRFTRTVFGVTMIVAFFLPNGRWATMILGILFLISAVFGYCITCEFYKKFIGRCKECEINLQSEH